MLTHWACLGLVTNFERYLSFSGNVIPMKAKLTFIMLAVLMLFAAPAYADIDCNIPTGIVTGYVVGENNVGISDVEVYAECLNPNNNCKSVTVYTGESDLGRYVVDLNCPVDADVRVTAKMGENVATGQGVMKNWLVVSPIAFVDDITMIPEFGLIAIPLLLSMAGFVFMKGRMI